MPVVNGHKLRVVATTQPRVDGFNGRGRGLLKRFENAQLSSIGSLVVPFA